jgi:hypothetical protein
MCKCNKDNPDKSCDKCRGGRPVKYYPKIIAEMIKYFNISPGKDVEVENSKGIMQSVRHAADFPTKSGFAISVGLDRSTLNQWSKEVFPEGHESEGDLKYPEFSHAYKSIIDYQKHILITNGLKGGYQANFAIFTAKNVLGWRDNKDIKLSGDKDNPLQLTQIYIPDNGRD